MVKPIDILEVYEKLKEKFDYNPETGVFYFKDVDLNRKGLRGKIAGGSSGNGYLRLGFVDKSGDWKTASAHRLAWFISYGFPLPGTIDHINNIKNDNRLCNLQSLTLQANARKDQHRNKCGYIGVRKWSTNNWGFQIKINGHSECKGKFNSPLEAASAYAERLLQWELTGA